MSGSGRKRGLSSVVKAEPDADSYGGGAAAASSSSSVVRRTAVADVPSLHSHPASNYRVGAVRRVRMFNFMIYSEAEVFPGPGLNLLLGPNGSGKSTVVSAIGIALAGNTESVGRFSKLSEYIRGQEQKCMVEVELHRAHRDGASNLVVARHFDRSGADNASKFFLGKDSKSLKAATKKEVEEEMKRLNIQVNNLCVYLAQFRVGKFAEMKEVELLEETEKAADFDLYKQHVQLSEDVVALKKRKEAATGSQNNADILKKQVEDLAGEMKAQEERAETEKRIKIIQKRIPWCEYETAVKFTQAREQEIVVREQELNAERAKHRPLEKAVKEKEKQTIESKRKEEAVRKSYQENRAVRASREKQYNECCEQIEELTAQWDSIENRERKRLDDLKSEKIKLNQFIESFAKLRTNDAISHERNALDAQNRQVRASDMKVRQQLDAFNQSYNSVNAEIGGLEQRLHTLQNKPVSNTITRLRNSLKIHERTNLQNEEMKISMLQQEGKLRGAVHGPLLSLLEVENPIAAAYVEDVIVRGNRTAWVVEAEEDLHTLTKNGVSTVINAGKLLPRKEKWDLRPHAKDGVDYLTNFVKCNDTVRSALNDVLGFENYICTTKAIPSAVAEKLISRDARDGKFRNLFTPTQNFSTRGTQYSTELAVTVEPMRATARILGENRQDDATVKAIAAVQKDLLAKQEELKQLNAERTEFMEKIKVEQADRRKTEAEINAKQSALTVELREVQSMHSRIDSTKSRISQLERVPDISKEKDRIESQKLSFEKKKETAQMELQNLDEAFPEKAVALAQAQIESQRLEAEFNLLQTQMDAILSSNSRLKAAVDAARKAMVAAKQAQDDRLRIARVKCDSLSYFNAHEAWLKKDITIEEATALASELELSLARGIGDPGIKDRFERLSKQMREAEMRSRLDAAEVSDLETRIANTKESWLKDIKEMVATIHSKFSEYFARIGCKGLVELHESEGKYGIIIKVSYRANVEPRPLSAATQSGGEKSVATMLYLLCLQAVTNSPFRMVDEINQGMDSKNEQTVFNQIVRACEPKKRSKSTSASASSRSMLIDEEDENEPGQEDEYEETAQYFVVTPKLLPDLQYSRRVTIFNVFNGPTALPQADWDLNKFLRIALSGTLEAKERELKKRRIQEERKLQEENPQLDDYGM